MDPRLLRTQFAAQAASLADQFSSALSNQVVSGHRVEMTAPEGSTSGGVQALQHIRLVPPNPGGRAVIVGNANRTTQSAEIRALAYVDQVSLERFGERTGFDPDQYNAFVQAAGGFLDNFGLRVTLAGPPAVLRPAAAPASKGLSPLMVVVIVIWSIAVLGIGLAVGVMATRGKLGH